jgi:hypothetical protein
MLNRARATPGLHPPEAPSASWTAERSTSEAKSRGFAFPAGTHGHRNVCAMASPGHARVLLPQSSWSSPPPSGFMPRRRTSRQNAKPFGVPLLGLQKGWRRPGQNGRRRQLQPTKLEHKGSAGRSAGTKLAAEASAQADIGAARLALLPAERQAARESWSRPNAFRRARSLIALAVSEHANRCSARPWTQTLQKEQRFTGSI